MTLSTLDVSAQWGVLPHQSLYLVAILSVAAYVLYKVLSPANVERPEPAKPAHQFATYTDIPYIKGIPEIPGALPVAGHLFKLGEDHATTCEKWWRESASQSVSQHLQLRVS